MWTNLILLLKQCSGRVLNSWPNCWKKFQHKNIKNLWRLHPQQQINCSGFVVFLTIQRLLHFILGEAHGLHQLWRHTNTQICLTKHNRSSQPLQQQGHTLERIVVDGVAKTVVFLKVLFWAPFYSVLIWSLLGDSSAHLVTFIYHLYADDIQLYRSFGENNCNNLSSWKCICIYTK